ncbi:MAG TPA: endospore germination permease [Desulfosporosinus sp.]|nr:endospore germination permease [Desulfosporosinus sp.]
MERISPHQFMTLGAAVLMGTTFLPVASIVTGFGGRDGWMSVMSGFALGVPYGLMVISLMEQYPHKNLLRISEILFGKWIGKIIGVLYIFITVYFGGLLLGQAGNIYQASIMPLTPISVFYLGGMLLVFYIVRSGIEVFARFSEVVFPVIVIALVLNVTLAIPRIEQGELMPILSEGLKPLFFGTLKVMPFPMEYILFLAGLLTFLPIGKQELGQLKNGVWRAVFLVGILNTLVALIQILVFGPTESIRLVYGLLVLGKMVEVSRTVSGIESLFMGVWLGALVIKVSAFFFTAIWGLETVFSLKGLKWYLAVGIIFLGIAFKFKTGPSLIKEIELVDNYLILPFASIWILTLWGFARWKKGAGV